MSSTLHALSASSASSGTLIAARWYDYIPIAIYFAFVIGVGLIARSKAATADGFLTSGRSLPAWATGTRRSHRWSLVSRTREACSNAWAVASEYARTSPPVPRSVPPK